MIIHMYLPDETRRDQFVITDQEGNLILKTLNREAAWSRTITNPAEDMDMLRVRFSSFFGGGFVFTDATGNRGTYHMTRIAGLVKYSMMSGHWNMLYDSRRQTVEIRRMNHVVAEARLLPEYALYFEIDLKETSEMIFTVAGLLAVAKEIDHPGEE